MNKLEQNIISEFINLGCNQRNAAVAYHVYMELCEVKRMHDVAYHYEKNLERMYLTGKYSKSADISIFIPVCTSENVSCNLLEKMLDINQMKSIYLALVSPDTTCVYYQLTAGLAEISELNKMSRVEKREKLDIEINNRRQEIEEAASTSSTITSKKDDSEISKTTS